MEKPKFLLVDDDEHILFTLEKALTVFDYQIEKATTGRKALKYIEQQDFHIVLLDLRLPDIDGLDVLREIRKSEKKPDVIMISAHGTVVSAVEAMKLGCVDFLTKPFDLSELREMIESVLRRKNMSQIDNLKFESLIQMVKIQAREQHFHKAIETMEKALEIKPDHAPSYNFLGALYEILGKTSEAITAYKTSTEIDPEYRPAADNLARIRKAGAGNNIILE